MRHQLNDLLSSQTSVVQDLLFRSFLGHEAARRHEHNHLFADGIALVIFLTCLEEEGVKWTVDLGLDDFGHVVVILLD